MLCIALYILAALLLVSGMVISACGLRLAEPKFYRNRFAMGDDPAMAMIGAMFVLLAILVAGGTRLAQFVIEALAT